MSTQLIAGLGGALIGAIVTGLFGWWLHQAEQSSVRKEELRRIIMNLWDLRQEFQNEVTTIRDPRKREAAGLLLNNKRMIYLAAAESLISKLGRNVSSSEYSTIAYEFMNDSDFSQAETFFHLALTAARSTLAKVYAYRSLAGLYFGQGPHRDFNRGRDFFQKAANELRNPADAYSSYTQGYTYETWGLAELYNGFQTEGNTLIDRARKYYNDLPNNYPLKQQSLEWLETKLSSVRALRQHALSPPIGSAAQVAQVAVEGSGRGDHDQKAGGD